MRVLPLVCLTVGVLLACDHKERVDENPARDAWTELSATMTSQVTSLRERQRAVTARITALAVPAGTEDVTLSAAIAELQSTIGPLDEAIGRVESAATQATADVNTQLAGKDKRTARRAVEAARTTFTETTAGAEPLLATLEPKLAAAEQIAQRLTAGTEAELNQLRRLAAAGGAADFAAVEFKAGGADLDLTRPAGKATLDRLVQFAASCPQLRFGINGRTTTEALPARNKELGLARADAVKAYLIAQGVEPAKIVRTAAADDGADRVSVEVMTSCAMPAPTVPVPPPAAAPPGSPRPNVELQPIAPPSRQPQARPTARTTPTPQPH